ncbi:MAG: hypothetical protein HC802_19665, partial [Caldilineaceae bacterium]|nr:hypothetical protein [Caldilineaceae bacterium]
MNQLLDLGKNVQTISSHLNFTVVEFLDRYAPLESLELYTAKSGDEIVGQLYSFED